MLLTVHVMSKVNSKEEVSLFTQTRGNIDSSVTAKHISHFHFLSSSNSQLWLLQHLHS